MGQMGSHNSLRTKLGRAAGVSAMVLAALSATLPTAAMAQDRGFRGAGRSEARVDGPSRPVMQNRIERSRDFGGARQPSPRAVGPGAPIAGPARVDNQGQRDFRGTRGDGQARQWRGQAGATAPTPGATWQQQRQGVRPNPADSRSVEQWRQQAQIRAEGQPNRVDGVRQGRERGQWRNRPGDPRDGRPDWQTSRPGQQNARPAWQNNRPDWQNARRNEAWRDNGWRNDRGSNRAWDRGWRSNSRYDWSNYRASNRTIYRLGRYNAPYASYRYSRVGVGFTLGSPFYGQNYWVSDPWQYRLPEVYGPYRWVRYYDDVVLVDIYSGEVVDVIYDFFW